jgi:hypothetical protein
LARRRKLKNKRRKYDGILDQRTGRGVHTASTKKSRTWETPRSPALLNEPVITVVAPYKGANPGKNRNTKLRAAKLK